MNVSPDPSTSAASSAQSGLVLVLGTRGADELALADQRVTPRALTDLRHHFRYPRLRAALDHELGAETVPAVL